MIRYTPTHEWVQIEGVVGTVGISAHAQKELGDVVFVQLPKIGEILAAGAEACVVESTKAAADIYSPLSGTVIAVNENLLSTPSLLNHSPEKDGWLYKLKISHPEEIDALSI